MRAYSIDFRLSLVRAYEKGQGSQRQLARLFGVSLSLVQRLWQQYGQEGTVAPKPHGGGNPAKIDSSRLAVVEQLQKQSPEATLEELCEQLAHKEGVRVSPTTMGRTLQKLKWTRKKTFHADEQDRPEVQQERTEYREKVAEINPEQLIFIDEMGTNLALARLYARAPQGQRAYASKPLNRGGNVTTIGALGLGGIKAVMTVDAGVEGGSLWHLCARGTRPSA